MGFLPLLPSSSASSVDKVSRSMGHRFQLLRQIFACACGFTENSEKTEIITKPVREIPISAVLGVSS